MVQLENISEAIFEYGQSDSFLTFEQAWNAKDRMKKHLLHIFHMIKDMEEGYPPTLQEDKNNPNLWKAEHWYWFIHRYIRK